MKTLKNLLAKVSILGVAVLPMLNSCYDDSSIWDKFDEIENRLETLEQSLNEQIQALSTIIDGKTTVTSCEKNADGSYKVTLSNGAKFTVLPDGTNYSALVSVITVNGVKCWATYDANGKLIALTDDAGQPIPVVNDYKAQVEVVVEDGAYYIVIDGKKYMTGYDTKDLVQVFSSCEQLKDASGNVYAMTFTFGDGVKVTVAVDGYNGVIFRLPSMVNSEVVTEYFVSYSDTQSLLLDMAGVIDYIMQIPDGWRVAERTDEYTGDKYIDITAPAAETIAAGAALVDGELKVVAVVEGGKAAVSKIMLSSNPFKTFEVNGSKAVVTPYVGVQKYVYGITKKSEYDEAALVNSVNTILQTTGDVPAGYGVSEGAINVEHTDTYGKLLENNVEYVFWALPALYSEGENGGFYVKEGTFQTYEFSNVTVKFGTTTASLFDAQISVTFTGVNKIYGGTVKKSEYTTSEVIRLINNGAYTPVEVSGTYTGPASTFPDAITKSDSGVEIMYGTEYVVWIVPYQEGKTTYTVNDVISTTFATKDVTSGSSLKVEFGDAKVEKTSISIPVSSDGAEMLAYVYMNKTDSDRISGVDNNTKAEIVLDHADCKNVKGNSADAKVDRLYPNTTMVLYAVAVDKNGKYGQVNTVSATTASLEYNALTVKATDLEVGSDKATFKIEVTDGEAADYIYWFGKSSDDFWLNVKYLGGNQTMASQYMALYPQDENIVRAMNKYGKVGTDGTLKVTELAKNTEYILLVAAKDANGLYSKAGYKMIVTLSANLGTVVTEGSAQWNAAKEAINIEWNKQRFDKVGEFATYVFNYTGPKDLTAFIICASDEYFEYDSKYKDVKEKIIEIENQASRQTSPSGGALLDANGEPVMEPTWYDGEGEPHPGYMASVSEFYVHGNPHNGFVSYFAEGGHELTCSCMENGQCTNLEKCWAAYTNVTTIDFYYAKFAGYYIMKGYEDAIQRAAEELLAFYLPFYEGKEPQLYVNDGSPLKIEQHSGYGVNDKGEVVDDVFIVLKDKSGNYYEPMKFEVPNLW